MSEYNPFGPTNDERVDWAGQAIAAFKLATGTDDAQNAADVLSGQSHIKL